jgi:hypothetical protein
VTGIACGSLFAPASHHLVAPATVFTVSSLSVLIAFYLYGTLCADFMTGFLTLAAFGEEVIRAPSATSRLIFPRFILEKKRTESFS